MNTFLNIWWKNNVLLSNWVHMLRPTGCGCRWDLDQRFPSWHQFSQEWSVETLVCSLLHCQLPVPPDWREKSRKHSKHTGWHTKHRRRILILLTKISNFDWRHLRNVIRFSAVLTLLHISKLFSKSAQSKVFWSQS